jgi:hypothetical protein
VVGTDRLPTFADRIHLPYIDAVVRGEPISAPLLHFVPSDSVRPLPGRGSALASSW